MTTTIEPGLPELPEPHIKAYGVMPALYTEEQLLSAIAADRKRGDEVDRWVDTRCVHLDETVRMGHSYDWDGWECSRLEMHTPHASFAIWPHQLGGKQRWSMYCNRDGLLMFERFGSKKAAQAEAEMVAESIAATTAPAEAKASVSAGLSDEQIFEIVASAMGNSLLAEDLREGFPIHTEAEDWLKVARALSSRLLPPDWVAVPREPTDEMVDAACDIGEGLYRVDFIRAYEAALSAAPMPKEPTK
jgi:hypothetical protein